MNQPYDVIVIGGGPAGLACSIYMARAKYNTLVLEKDTFGGQIRITSEVVNYPGVYHTSGSELTKEMQKQALAFHAQFQIAEVQGFKKKDYYYEVYTNKGTFQTIGIVLATGASPRKIGFDGETKFQGRGVAYCATCDGEFFTNKPIFVIGSGFAACEEALFLTRFSNQVSIMMITDDFTCTGNIVDEVKAHPSIRIHYETFISQVSGEQFVQQVSFKKGDETVTYEEKNGLGVFVFAGYEPSSAAFKDYVDINQDGYIITDATQKTNLEGVYAAGDICIKPLRQVVTAVSDGALAATSLEKYVASIYETHHLEKQLVETKKQEIHSATIDSEEGVFISQEIKQQLQPIFEKCITPITIKYDVNDSEISKEVEVFMQELASIPSSFTCKKETLDFPLPSISLFDQEDTYLGVNFHGVPGGHEFNSFVIGLYNASSEGQAIEPSLKARIQAISNKIHLQLAVTLSCTNCPDLVMACERIALLNPNITLDIYDLAHFESLKEKHTIMSVPCLIIHDKHIHFGKKDIEEVTALLEAL